MNDQPAAGNGKLDAHVKRITAAMLACQPLNGNAAAYDVAVEVFELGGFLLHERAQGIGPIESMEADLYEHHYPQAA